MPDPLGGIYLAPPALQVGGLARFSTVDWPGMMVAVIFCQGCAWRCRYCHNPALIPFRHQTPDTAKDHDQASSADSDAWTWPGVEAWLRNRRGLLDGVVFSGGEPTLQPGLVPAIRRARDLGFRVGLHTAGQAPERLAEALPWVDWVGFDFKAPFAAYPRITGRPNSGTAAEKSLRQLLASGVALEVRTTWHPALLAEADITAMADSLAALGVTTWTVQRFRTAGCADADLCKDPVGELPLDAVRRPGLEVRVR